MENGHGQTQAVNMDSIIGTNLKFFTRWMFGVIVEGRVVAATRNTVTIQAYFHGARWKETHNIGTEFYRYNGGEPFRFEVPK
jgi:hypothetical protein